MDETQAKIEKLYCLAQDRYHHHDLTRAINSLKALLLLDFQHFNAHFLLAIIYQKDQSFELSTLHFVTCLKSNSEKKNLYKLIAFNHIQLGLYMDAIYELQKHIHTQPHDDEAFMMLGDIYLKQQKYHYAKKVYLDAAKIDPKNPLYYLKLSKLYKESNDFHQALIEAKKALAVDPGYHEALFCIATLYVSLNKHEQAVIHYKKAIALNPSIAIYHNNLAVSFAKLKQIDEAKKAQTEALALEPKNKNFLNNLNRI